MTSTAISADVDRLKTRLRTIWMAGDYDRFSRHLVDSAREFYKRIPVAPGGRVLDVGCGSGQLALMAAEDGLEVTGVDIAGNLIEQARARAQEAGLQIRFDEGDAEALPFPDGQFDVVTSLIGAMFAPRPELVAAELLRVCKPGGIVAMANWTAEGFVGQMFKEVANFIAPSGMPSPVLWGDESTVRNRFGSGVSELQLTRRLYRFLYPFSPADVVQHFQLYYGPINQAFAALDGQDRERLRQALEALWTRHNRGGEHTTRVSAEYLEVVAVRA